jgi:hypothetical protein
LYTLFFSASLSNVSQRKLARKYSRQGGALVVSNVNIQYSLGASSDIFLLVGGGDFNSQVMYLFLPIWLKKTRFTTHFKKQ